MKLLKFVMDWLARLLGIGPQDGPPPPPPPRRNPQDGPPPPPPPR